MDLEQVREWTTNSTEATTIYFKGGAGGEHEFQPAFTYPIFGEEELIYGYKDLSIQVRFDSRTLLPYARVDYSEKRPEVEDNGVLNELLKYLPWDTCGSEDEWLQRREEEQFSIPGTEITVLDTPSGDKFHVYKTDIKECNQLLERFQIFTLFFIEAGSYIDKDDESWEIYLIYKDNVEFAGFSTVYPYFWYKDAVTHDSIEDLFYRKRISQFVVLPPYQHNRVGQLFYKTLMARFLDDDRVKQVTVEDPSEAFDVIRDRADLELLSSRGMFDDSKFTLPLDHGWIQQQAVQHKMAERQFVRCVEMGLLKNLGNLPNKTYRLLVKKRLFLRNREGLADKSQDEVKELLETLSTSNIVYL
jgi:histone acetyltransferase 1